MAAMAKEIGADRCIFQELPDLTRSRSRTRSRTRTRTRTLTLTMSFRT